MVFGWKKKIIFVETEVSQPLIEKNLELSQAIEVVEDVMTLRKNTLISQVTTFRNKIIPNLDHLLNIIKQLEKDELTSEDVDKHLKSIVFRGKKQVVSIIKKEAATELVKINTYDDVSIFETQLSQILKKMGDVLGRQTRVIHIFAKKHAVKLKIVLSSLKDDNSEIHKLIDNVYKLEEKQGEVIEAVKEVQNGFDEQKKIVNRISVFNESKNDLNSKIENEKNTINKLKETDEFSQYENINKKIDSLYSEKDQIKNKIDIQFIKISRPLSKYVYISSLDRDVIKILESLISNPFEVLTRNNKNNIITILESVLRGIRSGTVSVKDSEKSIQQINETSEMLDEFLNIVSDFEDKKAKMKNELKVFNIDELNQHESTLTKTENEIEDLETKIKNLNNESDDIKKRTPKLIENIEEWMKIISATQYKITI